MRALDVNSENRSFCLLLTLFFFWGVSGCGSCQVRRLFKIRPNNNANFNNRLAAKCTHCLLSCFSPRLKRVTYSSFHIIIRFCSCRNKQGWWRSWLARRSHSFWVILRSRVRASLTPKCKPFFINFRISFLDFLKILSLFLVSFFKFQFYSFDKLRSFYLCLIIH